MLFFHVVNRTMFTLALLLACVPASAQMPCYRMTDVIGGEMRVVTTRHPNGTRLEVMQLVARPGACMSIRDMNGRMQNLPFRLVHLTSDDARLKARLREAVGHVIWVRSRDVMPPHTAWHVGDIVMFEVELLAVDPL